MSASPDDGATSAWPPPFDPSLVQRGRQLLREHGVLLVAGPTGSGRLALARGIASPWPVRIHRGTIAGVSTPYYALRRLAPHLAITEGLSPADLALELERQRPADLPALTVVLVAADLCDHASLSTLAERASMGALGLIGIITPEALRHHPLLGAAATIELPALDHPAVADMLRHRFDCEPDPVVVEFVHARSQGVHDAIIDVTESALRLGLLARIEGTLALMPDPGESTTLPPVRLSAGSFAIHDLLEVGPQMTDLLQIVALVDEVDVHEVLAVVPAATLDLAVVHGILTIDDDTVRFANAAESAAVDASLTLARRVELHDLYCDDFPRTFERPRAAMRAALCRRKVHRPVEPELAVRAARQANLEGLHREAVTITQPDEPGGPVAGAMERAFALVELGEVAELVELLETLDPTLLTEEELLDFILLRWSYVRQPGPEDADVVTGDETVARRRGAVLRLAQHWAGSFATSSVELENEIRALIFSGALSGVNTATAYLALSTCQRNGGRPHQAVESAQQALEQLRREPLANAFVLDPALELLAIAQVDMLDFPAAERTLVEYSSRPAPHGRAARIGHALWGLMEYRRGRLGLALTHARLCLESVRMHDPQEISGWVQAMTAELLAQHGLVAEAEAMLERSDLAPAIRRTQHHLERRIAEAAACDAVGRVDEATTLLRSTLAVARGAGLRKAEIDAAALLVQIGGPDLVPELARAVADVTDLRGVPGTWRRFVDLVEAADPSGLVDLVGDLRDARAVVLAAEIAQFTLAFTRTSGTPLSGDQHVLLEEIAFGRPQPVQGVQGSR